MKRWVAALLAVMFLFTATLHVFAHHGDADGGCAVCHVQRTSLPGGAAPAVAAGPVLESPLTEFVAPSAVAPRPAASAARGPPVLPA